MTPEPLSAHNDMKKKKEGCLLVTGRRGNHYKYDDNNNKGTVILFDVEEGKGRSFSDLR